MFESLIYPTLRLTFATFLVACLIAIVLIRLTVRAGYSLVSGGRSIARQRDPAV